MIITYYGDGKGKTTAALGLALRASGYGMKTLIIQFIKGDWKSGEEIVLQKNLLIKLKKFGLGFVGIADDQHKIKEHKEAAQRALGYAKKQIASGKFQVIILDEILGAIEGQLIKRESTIEMIKQKPAQTTLILTGRPKVKEIISGSDLVTKFTKIKHPWDSGRKAVKGLDF